MSIVVDNFPTKYLMESAKKDNFMVLAFIVQPDSVVDIATARAYQDGWLAGLGLEPNPRLALVTIPRNVDFESAVNAYIKQLNDAARMPASFFLSTPIYVDIQGLKFEDMDPPDEG